MICDISIVIPVYNEQDNIIQLIKEVRATLEKKINYEIIIVDDGSDDNTYEVLNKIKKNDKLLTPIKNLVVQTTDFNEENITKVFKLGDYKDIRLNETNLKNQNILFSGEKTQEEGSIPRRLVAKACIEALKTKDSIEKIIEITSSEENPKTNMSKAIKAFSI